MIKKINLSLYLYLAVIMMLAVSGCKTGEPAVVAAEIIKKVNPPSPPLLISYKVNPENFIKDNYGYIGIKYLTREEEIEKIKTRLDKKNAAAEDYLKAYKRIPEFGNIILHIGRKDLMHANTKWYHYSVEKGNKYLIKYTGEEGIPNIKGQDGNWWNIVKLPIREDIEDTLSIVITDNKTSEKYHFIVQRVETAE